MSANKDRVQLLVDRLRSGQDEQATGALNDGVGKCCLGVACEVARENGLALYKDVLPAYEGTVLYDGEESVLPESVREWFGFESDDPFVHGDADDSVPTFAMVNDDFGLPFEDIAILFEDKYIKENS